MLAWRMRSTVLLALAILALAPSCKRSEPTIVDVGTASPSAELPSSAIALPPPPAKPDPVAAAVPPQKQIAWTLPKGPLSSSEKALVGTWAASVGEDATRSAFMADKVMFGLGGTKGGIDGIVDAVKNDNRIKTSCVWLELFDDRTGIRRECAIVNGEPSALDMSNPLTGQKTDAGTKLSWYYDLPAKVVRVRFDGDMLVRQTTDGGVRDLRFRIWVLRLGEKVGDAFKVEETIPEHDYKVPTQYSYEIFPGSFLDKR